MSAPAALADLRYPALGCHPRQDMPFSVAHLASSTGGRVTGAASHPVLDRLVTDSREAGPGAVFVALVGEQMDGHDFIDVALERGASALLCRDAPPDPAVPCVVVPDTTEALVGFARAQLTANRVQVVAVTGSAGKTTTKEMVASVLAMRYSVLRGDNRNTYTGLAMNLAQLEPTHDVFVGEYGMDGLGQIAFLARMAPPDIALVLNVGLAHVGLLGSIEAIARAKRELVEAVGVDGIALLNADDQRVTAMASACRGRVLFFGTEDARASNDFSASRIELRGLGGSSFSLRTPAGEATVRLAVPGHHAVSNAVAAAGVAHLVGVGLDATVEALESFRPVSGRLNLRPGRRGAVIVDDAYNASPGSMDASLQVLASEPGRTRIAVLGDMLELGDEAPEAHRAVGRAAGSSADLLVALGDHAGLVVAAAREAGMPTEAAHTAADVDAAIELIAPHLEGAVVLVKASRGMALDRVVERLVSE
ncbi:MAG: UDP-N-acetylmuramoyl-tripeptide--D-alanyl-D-alanine ligase [Candidatus Dormibacteria bacterium]